MFFALLFLSVFLNIYGGRDNITVKKMPNNLSTLILFLFAVTYIFIASFYNTYSLFYVLKRAVYPVLAFVIGYVLGQERERDISNRIILAIAGGFFVYGFLNYSMRASNSNLVETRASLDIWSGAELFPTYESTFFLFVVSLTFYYLICNRIKTKIVGFASIIVACSVAIGTASRTLIVLTVGSVMGFELLFIIYNKRKSNNKIKILLTTLTLALIAYGVFAFNAFGIREKILSSELVLRMTTTDVDTMLDFNQRSIRYAYVFSKFGSHLMGNIDMGALGTAHNTWLDIFRVSGIIPMVLYIVFTIRMIMVAVKLWKKHVFFEEKYFVCLSIVICSNLLFFVESIIALHINYFWAYLIVCGIMEGKYKALIYNTANRNTEVSTK